MALNATGGSLASLPTSTWACGENFTRVVVVTVKTTSTITAQASESGITTSRLVPTSWTTNITSSSAVSYQRSSFDSIPSPYGSVSLDWDSISPAIKSSSTSQGITQPTLPSYDSSPSPTSSLAANDETSPSSLLVVPVTIPSSLTISTPITTTTSKSSSSMSAVESFSTSSFTPGSGDPEAASTTTSPAESSHTTTTPAQYTSRANNVVLKRQLIVLTVFCALLFGMIA